MTTSFLDSKCESWKMTESIAAHCQPYSCSNDKHIDKFFHEEFADYDYQMLGKTYCFITSDRQKMVAAFTVANSSVRVDDMPKSKRNKLNRKIPFSKQRSSSDLEEMQYMSKSEHVEDGEFYRETRLMLFDLISLRS